MKLCVVRGRKIRLSWTGLLVALSFVVTGSVPGTVHSTTVRIADAAVAELLDPVRLGANWTQAQAGALFDQLYTYDYLARPVRLRPLAASGMPKVSADGREVTVGIRPGIRFTPHPAFGNGPRELTAEDFIYSVKRMMDPAIRSPVVSLIAGKIEGLDDVAARTTGSAARFDYDAKVSGLVAVDRFTIRIRLTQPDPTFVYLLAHPALSIVPREAVEADQNEFARRPTGSGPYVVREFKPGTRLALQRNPNYRATRWEDIASGGPTDPEWAAALRGRRFPLPDRVELLYIPEPATGLLALERHEIDVLYGASRGIENNQLNPRLSAAGFKLVRGETPDRSFITFNLRDPLIGGISPVNMALRRAIAMAIDDDEFIRVLANGNGSVAKYLIPPGIGGHDPAYRGSIRYDPAAANALLDHFGYRKERDGYRRRPDGGELTLSFIVGTSSEARHRSEFLKHGFDRIGVRLSFEAMPYTERMSRVATCHFQLALHGWAYDWPDGSNMMLAFYGRSNGTVSVACMEDPDFDSLYERLVRTPLGPERAPLYRRLIERLDVLTPIRLLPNSDDFYLAAPNIRGLLIHPALPAVFPYLDVTANSK